MLSKYVLQLDSGSKHRYLEKISAINGVDPFSLSKLDADALPPVEATDLVNCLVLGTSAYTHEQFKAYRSLEAYNQCVNGWVQQVAGCKVNDKYVVVGKVKHSQSFAATPAHCWVICEHDGAVVTAHCKCKAGLGETCSHVAALLFYMEIYNRLKGPAACTQTECKWLIPAHVRTLHYRPLSQMDFVSPRLKKKRLETAIGASAAASSAELPSPQAQAQPAPATSPSIPSATTSVSSASSSLYPLAPSEAELTTFYTDLSECSHKPALLSVIHPFCEHYVPEQVGNVLPLTSLYSRANASMTVAELMTMAEAVNVSLSESEVEFIELCTRGQSRCDAWYDYRAGRITASKMKSVCRTKIAQPSISLLKSVCYPKSYAFKNPATEWGLQKEAVAIDRYRHHVSEHEKVSVEQCGLVIHPQYCYIAASPDSLVSCACCGFGIVEVKCPYKYRFCTIEEYVYSKDSCFKTESGDINLSARHAYYYQVQTQMQVCDAQFCDFVLCTFNDDVPSIFVKRVLRDDSFWGECYSRASSFFRHCVLPELLGRAFTRPQPVC